MTGRNASKEEGRYISKAYKATEVVGIYILNIGILIFVLSIGLMFIAAIGENDVTSKQFFKVFPGLLIMCAVFLFIFVKAVKDIKNKRAVRKGNYVLIEGMAERYTPYEVPEVTSYVTEGGAEYSNAGAPVKDGKIIFRANDGTREPKEIPLKYSSCPRGRKLGEFPVFLIILPNGEKFAVTDWNKIRNNQEYAHIKPFMIIC